MASDDLSYVCLLAFSVCFGPVLKRTYGYRNKQLLSSGIGLIIVLLWCRQNVLHSLIAAFINSLIIKFASPRSCHWISFAWCFGYLAFFRTTSYFGLPAVQPLANAVQLILTLKLIGLAFEVHATYKNKQAASVAPDGDTVSLQDSYQNIDPSIADMMLYSYCYIGLFTGPYYKFRTYVDMLHQQRDITNLKDLMLARVKRLPVYVAAFFIASHYFSIQYVQTEEFASRPFWLRFFYMSPIFFIFRMRFYCAWILAECMCMTAGLGAYPVASQPRCGKGPTDYQALHLCKDEPSEKVLYDFETVRNIQEYDCEFAPSVRAGLRSWNTTVQYWLASNVYKHLPVKSSTLKVAMTMGVSAYWHGIHPGYYLSFLTVPPTMMVNEMFAARFRNGRSPWQPKIFDWLCWFFKMRLFEYMCMGFLLLSFEATVRYWSSVYFIWHLWLVGMLVAGTLLAPTRTRAGRQSTGAGQQDAGVEQKSGKID